MLYAEDREADPFLRPLLFRCRSSLVPANRPHAIAGQAPVFVPGDCTAAVGGTLAIAFFCFPLDQLLCTPHHVATVLSLSKFLQRGIPSTGRVESSRLRTGIRRQRCVLGPGRPGTSRARLGRRCSLLQLATARARRAIICADGCPHFPPHWSPRSHWKNCCSRRASRFLSMQSPPGEQADRELGRAESNDPHWPS